MSDLRKSPLSDQELEELFRSSLDALPPEEIPRQVNPWRFAMLKIIAGFVLTSITLHFFHLDRILPAMGFLLLYLGFRPLRKENPWLRMGWLISSVRVILSLAFLLLDTSIWHEAVYHAPVFPLISGGILLLGPLLCLCLWRGILAVQKKAGAAPHAGSAAMLLLWNIVLLLMAVVKMDFIIASIAMLAAYAGIIRSLWKLSSVLEDTGYVLEPAAARFSDLTVAAGLAAVLAVGMLCSYLFLNTYPMDWTACETAENQEVSAVRDDLLRLGFPGDVLADLTNEDILGMKGSTRVLSGSRDHPMGKGRLEKAGDTYTTVFDANELRITGVAVLLPGEREEWRLIHHFRWVVDPHFCGTEAIQLWPAYRMAEGWTSSSEVTGRLLCDMDGQSYTSPYHFLGPVSYRQDSIFWGEQTSTDIFAAFSMPRKAENHRGYLTYSIEEVNDGCIIDGNIHYTHQFSPFQFPVLTAMQSRIRSGWSLDGVFRTDWTSIQFYPFREGSTLFGYEDP